MTKYEALRKAQREIWNIGPFFRTEMAQYTIELGFNKGVEWKDEQINLLLDAIDYAYLKTDGTYGDLPLVVVDEVEYLKSLRHGKIE